MAAVLTTVLFLISSVLVSVIFSQNVQREQQQIEMAAAQRGRDMVQRMDWMFTELVNFSVNMRATSWVCRAMSDSEVLTDTVSEFDKIEIRQDMAVYKGVFRMADSVAVIFPRRDLAVSDVAWCDVGTYMRSLGFTHWQSVVDGLSAIDQQKLMIWDASSVYDDPRREGGLLIAKRIDTTDKARAVAFAYIDNITLARNIMQSDLGSLASFQILSDDTVLYELKGSAQEGSFRYEQQSGSSTFRYRIMAEPSDTATQPGPVIYYLAYLCLLGFSALLGVGLTLLIYRPIARLLDKIDVRVGRQEQEFDAILRSYQELIAENDDLAETNMQYLSAVRNNALIQILWGCFDENTIDQSKRINTLQFLDDRVYCVLILNDGPDASLEKKLANHARLKDMRDRYGLHAEIVDNMDNACVAIIDATDQEEAIAAAVNDLRGQLRQIDEEAADELLCSKAAKGVLGISVAYHSLRRDYSRRQHAAREMHSPATAFLPHNWVSQFKQNLRSGNMPVARKILVALQNENRKSDTEYQVCKEVYDKLCDLMDEIRMDRSKYSVPEEQTPFWTQLYLIMTDIGAYQNEQEARTVSEEARQIRTYIDEHLCDSMLTQQTVADTFDMTQSMVSKVFKRAYNQNFLDYLQMRRIELACRRFDEGETVIAQVAESVGYDNEVTFKRVFQKYMSVSPRTYLNQGSHADK